MVIVNGIKFNKTKTQVFGVNNNNREVEKKRCIELRKKLNDVYGHSQKFLI